MFHLFPALIAIALALLLVHRKTKNKKRVPPGRMGLPWIGETLDFRKAQKKNRLYQDFILTRVHKHGTTFKTRLMGRPTLVVGGPHANRHFLSNEFKLVVSSWPASSVRLMGQHSIMEKQGAAHGTIRAIISASLSPTGLEALVSRICAAVRAHLEKHSGLSREGEETVSLYGLAKALTFTVILECLMGIKSGPDMLAIFERVLEGVFSVPVELPWSKFGRARRARREIERVLVGEIRRRKEEMERRGGERMEEEGGILLSRLVGALIRGEITEEEVVDNVVLLIFAAHDTTSFAIAMTFRMLAQHPDCYSILEKEHREIASRKGPEDPITYEDTKTMGYTWKVAQESMRIFPPIFGSFRKAIQDIEYDGYTIPKGWKILWTAYGTHYNPECFQDPMMFNPDRFGDPIQPYTFVPFGGGPRHCAGYQLAKLNILIFVHFVVTRYDWSLVLPDEPITMDPLPFPSLGMPVTMRPNVRPKP